MGRPNVGKSTLFNRLTQTRAAIVNDTSGTTRDRQYGKMEWNGMEMSVVDTGGWVVNSEDIFEEEINKQVHLAIEEADVILFVVDIKNGITDLDDHVADILRRTSKPVIVVANKDDNNQSMYAEAEFYALGLGKPFSISAANGNGTGDLLDEVVKKMPAKSEETLEEELPRFAIVGRPNAGKSSLVNSLMDEERNIVTDIAGTTRDSIYSRYNKFGFDFYLVDTAGIRKKNKVNEDIEYYSVLRSIRAIENSDVCILLIDDVLIGLLGHLLDNLVEQVSRAGTVDGRDGERLPESEGVELGLGIHALVVVVLVGHDDDRFGGAAQDVGNVVVKVGNAVLDVHDKEDDIGLLDGELYLLVDLFLKDVFAVHDPSTGINDRHFHAVPFHLAVLAVACRAAGVVDDGGARLSQAVEQC